VDKTQRSYSLLVDLTEQPVETVLTAPLQDVDQLEIKPPLTLEFEINRNILASANDSTFRVYNLGELAREGIKKAPQSTINYRGIELRAGYEQNLATCFKGNIKRAFSVRRGTSWVTTIENYDGAFAFINGEVSKAFQKGIPYNDILDHIVSTLPAIKKGARSNYQGTLPRGNSLSGNPAALASELSRGGFFVDLEKAYMLQDQDVIKGSVQVISSESGLLGTPRREDTVVTVEMVFEPGLLIGQVLELRSKTAKVFNGEYKVISLQHRGVISEAVSGDCMTTVGLWLGPGSFNVVG
jgi:hypothetical protein